MLARACCWTHFHFGTSGYHLHETCKHRARASSFRHTVCELCTRARARDTTLLMIPRGTLRKACSPQRRRWRVTASLSTMGGGVTETSDRPAAPLFAAQYIKAQHPVVLRGYCKDWRATQRWHDPTYMRQLAGEDRLLSVERSEDGHFSYASEHGRTTVPLGIACSTVNAKHRSC